jgi:hypothetical protein
MTPAAVMWHKGGTNPARKLGSDHFRRMAAARKTRVSGRQRKAE